MISFKKRVFLAALPAALLLLFACSRKKDDVYTQTMFVFGTPAHVKVFGSGEAEGKKIADAVFKEWKRISDEYSFEEPYSYTTYVNNKAYGEWVRVDDEFLRLLSLSMDYYNLTGGAFDITFAPLWPIWKEAAASKKMPSKEVIARALSNMGSGYVQIDYQRKVVRFTKPVQINMGGILRGYCFERGREIVKKFAEHKYPVELRIGGYMLGYGKRDWSYEVPDPFHDGHFLGRIRFADGVVMSSSGRDHFVLIEDKLYSHMLDLKTGYPLPDFSNLIVYFPSAKTNEYIPSSVLAVMGKPKAFALLGRLKGTAALWVDGAGKIDVFVNERSKASWEKSKRLF
jgi:thiamine biosynthesis lipoprotein